MKLHLIRYSRSETSLIGKLAIDGVFQCFTLENAKLAIPEGTYTVKERWSKRNGCNVPGLCGVPGHTDIEIHIANSPEQLLGCIAVGTKAEKDYVGHSMIAFNALMSRFCEPCTIEIESIHLDIEKPDAAGALA